MPPQRSPSSKGSPSDPNVPTRRSRNSSRLAASVTVGVAHQSEARRSLNGGSQSPRPSFHDLGVQASPVAGVDDGSRDPPHSRLCLEVENLQHRKEVLDGEVRLLEKSKEIACLKEALNDLQKKLDTVVEARDNAFCCLKCKRITQEPIVMQECAHGFCEPCLRDWFDQQIRHSLEHLDIDKDLKEPPYDMAKVARLRVTNNLAFANLNCPRCKSYAWRRPKATPFVTQLADTLSDVLGGPKNAVEKVLVDADEDIWKVLFID